MPGIVRIPKAGEIIDGQFRLGAELGRGAFGIVFEAEQLELSRRVAVKILHPRALANSQVAERFKREARLVSALRHPNTVTVYAFGEYGKAADIEGLPYMAMEYLEGEDLHDYLARNGPVPQGDAAAILLQTLGSVSEAHSRGIIHRDLKPENIFIARREDGENTIKILDFGIAKAISEEGGELVSGRSLTAHGMVCGTPQYMAPEQATGERNLTPAVDVYALGCIAYELVTGSPPFTGRSPMDIALKHLSNPVPDLPPELEDSALGEVIHRALSKDPLDRFANAQELEEKLRAVMGERVGVIPAPRITPRSALPSGGGEVEGEEPAVDSTTSTSILEVQGLMGPEEPPPMPRRGGTAVVAALVPPVEVAPDLEEDEEDRDGGRGHSARLPLVAMIAAGVLLMAGASVGAAVLLLGGDDAPAATLAEAPEAAARVKITIESQPSDAEVFLNGVRIGATPMVYEREQSEDLVRLVVSREGFAPSTREVVPSADQAVQVELVAVAGEAGAEVEGDDALAQKGSAGREGVRDGAAARRRAPQPRGRRGPQTPKVPTQSQDAGGDKIELWK